MVLFQAGGSAGVCVDLTLFPLDTLKTRLQSASGFRAAGGFRGVYSGILSAGVGSFPTGAAFFMTYEAIKTMLGSSPPAHMTAASVGEVVACVIRVPVEVVKQRAQAFSEMSTRRAFVFTLQQEGILGFYRGFKCTAAREVPFSLVQFPLWEFFKKYWSGRQGRAVDPWQGAVCGAFAGGFSAALTTPLDVAKTRIMLAKAQTNTAVGNVLPVIVNVYKTQGVPGLFAGILPRVLWISFGGFIFLGSYQKIWQLLQIPTSRNSTSTDITSGVGPQ
uniref:Mitochondrial S-adenosylmethionine carrier protein n=1 Tax=Eptatretus burgeri TaxID=7764 RepID=A0A8C4QBJ0_EPTBU